MSKFFENRDNYPSEVAYKATLDRKKNREFKFFKGNGNWVEVTTGLVKEVQSSDGLLFGLGVAWLGVWLPTTPIFHLLMYW